MSNGPITNSRYINYARVHDRTPEEQLIQDRKDWPGGVMVGFVQWNRNMIRMFADICPAAFTCGSLTDHPAYDAWLDKQNVLPALSPAEGLKLKGTDARGYFYSRLDDETVVAQHQNTWEEGAFYSPVNETKWEWTPA